MNDFSFKIRVSEKKIRLACVAAQEIITKNLRLTWINNFAAERSNADISLFAIERARTADTRINYRRVCAQVGAIGVAFNWRTIPCTIFRGKHGNSERGGGGQVLRVTRPCDVISCLMSLYPLALHDSCTASINLRRKELALIRMPNRKSLIPRIFFLLSIAEFSK